MIDEVADDEGWEDQPAKKAGGENEKYNIGQGDEDHQWPDVEENGGQLRVWVRFVFRPQDQVRPGKSLNSEESAIKKLP